MSDSDRRTDLALPRNSVTSCSSNSWISPAPDPSSADSPERPPVAAPRPPGAYPRAIAHNEQVEYSYDPETGEFHARIVDSSEPVVTRWDDSPPEQTERPVGTFDVTPTEGGVQAEETGRAVVPEGVKAELKRQAEESRVPGSGVRGRGSGERETTASSLAGKEESSRKEDNSGQGKDGPAGAIAQGGNGR